MADVQLALYRFALSEGAIARVAEDASALARYLMTDPQLLAMMACALTGPHPRLRVEGTRDHVVIENARVVSAAPYLVAKLESGPARLVLVDLDWPLLLWPYIAWARELYDLRVRIDRTDARTLMLSRGEGELAEFGEGQAVPVGVLEEWLV